MCFIKNFNHNKALNHLDINREHAVREEQHSVGATISNTTHLVTADLSSFNKRCSDAYLVTFLFDYYCTLTHKNVPLKDRTTFVVDARKIEKVYIKTHLKCTETIRTSNNNFEKANK